MELRIMTDTIYIGILIVLFVVVCFGDIKLSDSLPNTMNKMKKKINTIKTTIKL